MLCCAGEVICIYARVEKCAGEDSGLKERGCKVKRGTISKNGQLQWTSDDDDDDDDDDDGDGDGEEQLDGGRGDAERQPVPYISL